MIPATPVLLARRDPREILVLQVPLELQGQRVQPVLKVHKAILVPPARRAPLAQQVRKGQRETRATQARQAPSAQRARQAPPAHRDRKARKA